VAFSPIVIVVGIFLFHGRAAQLAVNNFIHVNRESEILFLQPVKRLSSLYRRGPYSNIRVFKYSKTNFFLFA
jgi:hypothetical protein